MVVGKYRGDLLNSNDFKNEAGSNCLKNKGEEPFVFPQKFHRWEAVRRDQN